MSMEEVKYDGNKKKKDGQVFLAQIQGTCLQHNHETGVQGYK
eukprot:CAMPEP_0119115948 /NCGR_PEP_ID=MMETSP1180-20130426/52021_1 /TAXON_ID=3052 ORGANISM="Chlamydomonas cf sp, Strain CCMP681" /NCGR_SAMPLE_ID=MMETSP1180 /ASSEMBLY_ACC=CAM_ASM_000741 /LENGTH=41 /DNA_ID= /DNA_START= /DNA_END= /DNA_ORIENTATION=